MQTVAKQNTEIKKVRRSSMFLDILKGTVRSPSSKIGAIILLIMIMSAVLAPLLTKYGPNELDLSCLKSPPSLEHPMGTDAMGRDLFSRLLYGGRYSLALGFAASIFSTVMSIIFGCVAGYFGGIVETVIMRIMDVLSALPSVLLCIMISVALGPGFFNTVLALSIGQIPASTRMMRAQILAERGEEYLEACESINCSKVSIMFKHLLPNTISPMIVCLTMGIGDNITAAASLSYIGLGVQPPTPEWGALLSSARGYIMSHPYMIIFPGLFIALTVLAANLVGDGLRDALDPKLRR
ncbi:MAG: ABC transporter permease [Lachnospiraceae bacterium]|jgi:ABC-type dipeptide/oligopeptide/nickel transport system permease subunit